MTTSNRLELLLPQEILTEILSLLPAKSLGRCKCVSKPWRSLISDPQFIKTHLTKRTHQDQKLLLISPEWNSFSIYDAFNPVFFGTLCAVEFNNNGGDLSGFGTKLNFEYPDKWHDVLGSCNGLILVTDKEGTKFLLNPTTLEAKKLQVSPFALDPRACSIMYGFGFDASSDDYKVVTVSYSITDNEHEFDFKDMFVDVYMLKRNVWKRVKNSPYDHSIVRRSSGVFVNGSLHWLAGKVSDHSYVIAAFDLTSEEFSEVALPIGIDNFTSAYNGLAVLRGCLCLRIDCFRDFQGEMIYTTDVWVMEEYGVEESWTKFSIVQSENPSFGLSCLFGDKKALLDRNGDTLLAYNFEDEMSRDMVVPGIPSVFRVGLTFVDSLVSHKTNNEIEGQNDS